ncbi:hypothetical protein SDRG_02287 [Saprolegnia diclina VS20]|uniref:Dephospho-CoA kinase n=1 Tax=Saprolegnia diclina (strain VS20) TaxID=1156394 RepID=T0QQI3_SAPDV|nr:hypothetical protein SDRG_02287 [Saprolegnia diclina VS20]EQC40389.1 hypothetical protein SDRG_02287 [Saprolegnia diclina VS20]|eukprot:XP_008606088.1 hypothetical protein SDRG_02287 [Saprolegnia diclina VS20]
MGFGAFVRDSVLALLILSASGLVGYFRRRWAYRPLHKYGLTLGAMLVGAGAYMFLRSNSGTLAALVLLFLTMLGFAAGDGCVAIGLTGGIATGKSTVSKRLREKGAVIIDADVVARQVVEPGQPAHRAIVAAFGTDILNPDRTLDRAKLGSLVFNDPAKRATLNSCTHKHILLAMFFELLYLRVVKRAKLVVFDAPLLFETQILEYFCTPIVVVACSEANQLTRLMSRDKLPKDQATKRIQAQMPLAEKAAKANIVLDNNDSPEALIKLVDATYETLKRVY